MLIIHVYHPADPCPALTLMHDESHEADDTDTSTHPSTTSYGQSGATSLGRHQQDWRRQRRPSTRSSGADNEAGTIGTGADMETGTVLPLRSARKLGPGTRPSASPGRAREWPAGEAIIHGCRKRLGGSSHFDRRTGRQQTRQDIVSSTVDKIKGGANAVEGG